MFQNSWKSSKNPRKSYGSLFILPSSHQKSQNLTIISNCLLHLLLLSLNLTPTSWSRPQIFITSSRQHLSHRDNTRPGLMSPWIYRISPRTRSSVALPQLILISHRRPDFAVNHPTMTTIDIISSPTSSINHADQSTPTTPSSHRPNLHLVSSSLCHHRWAQPELNLRLHPDPTRNPMHAEFYPQAIVIRSA